MPFLILLFFGFFLLNIFFFLKQYKKVPHDQVLVIYGKVESNSKHGMRIITQGGEFVFPIIQDCSFLKIKRYQSEFTESFLSKDQTSLELSAAIAYGLPREESLLAEAALHLLGATEKEIQALAQSILQAQLESIFANMDLADLALLQQGHFDAEIKRQLNSALNKVGLELIQFRVQQLRDKDRLLATLQQKQLTAASQPAATLSLESLAQNLSELEQKIEQNATERLQLLKSKVQLLQQQKNETKN